MRRLSLIVTVFFLLNNLFSQDSPHGDSLTIACEDCHNPNGWEMLAGTYTFNHNITSFQLEGQHGNVDCKSCHESLIFKQAQTSCVSCHTDMHEQTVGMDCARCHTPVSWIVPNIIEMHEQSRFPLVGAHRVADCYSCHTTSASLLSFEPLGVNCIDCHQNDYYATTEPDHVLGNYSLECTECHDMNAFTWTGAGINHDFFPLVAGHEVEDCYQCHTEGTPFSNITTLCVDCHQDDYNATNNPDHSVVDLSTNCNDCHTTEPGWKPATFTEHDVIYFPVYSGSHNGEWDNCDECHPNASVYAQYTCIDCHDHRQSEMDDEHEGINGYIYESTACFECHPTGDEEGFNHNASNFPLTGAHITTDCQECHSEGYAGTPINCTDCHNNDYLETTNPNHNTLGLSNDCAVCHTTNPDWIPATFSNHDDYYVLHGAHSGIANECFECHAGNYNNTANSCFGCHEDEYNQTDDPPHLMAQFTTDCEDCHSVDAWDPSTFDHDAQYFPIYSGSHNEEWDLCSECHTNPANYSIFSCTICHEQGDMDDDHEGINGYVYESNACFECHPDGEGDGFNHDASNFPLTGAHTTVDCQECHENGYSGTPVNCTDCHDNDYLETSNPNHNTLGLSNECATCHTTEPGWVPAGFPDHDDFYVLDGAHLTITNDCFECHAGNYNNTSSDCSDCHNNDYLETTNPNHNSLGLSNDCAICHTTNPDWVPAEFPNHNDYFVLQGAHLNIAGDCAECHSENYNSTPNTCFGCHEDEYNQTNDPPHASAQFSTDCIICHSENAWEPSTFDHDSQYFPIYSGEHNGEWNTCSDCHTNPANYSVYSCTVCHLQGDMDDEHDEVSGYIYLSSACLECHPDGEESLIININKTFKDN